MPTAQLAIDVTAKANGVADTFSGVGSSAVSMGDDISSAAAKADAAAGRFDGVAASAENMDDKAGKATGALGALSAGFELVGAEKYAGALQGAAMATDFFSGVGQAMNLVLELESVQRAKAVVTAGAHKAATLASAAASKVAAGAQIALNVAMRANPIALVVTAIAALAAGIVLAYKRSETFRGIVQAAMGAARSAVATVVGPIQDVVGWFGKIPTAVGTARDRVTGAVGSIKDTVLGIPDAIGRVADSVRDGLGNAFTAARDRVVPIIDAIRAPFQALYDLAVRVIDKIQSIKLPNIPGLGRVTTSGKPSPFDPPIGPAGGGQGPDLAALLTLLSRGGGPPPVEITVNGALDPAAVAQQIARLLRRHGYALGGPA